MILKKASLILDHYFDRFLFHLLMITGKLFYGRRELKGEDIKRILILNLDHIGDVLVSTPAVSFLRSACPGAKITAAVTALSKNVIKDNPDIDEIITISAPWLTQKKAGVSIRSLLAVFGWGILLRRKKFELVVDFRHAESKNILLSRLTGAVYRLGFGLSHRGIEALNTHHVLDMREKHIVFQKAASLEKFLNKRFKPKNLFMKVSEAEENYARNLWEKYDLDRERLIICISPESNREISRWPLGNFVELALRLEEDFKARILITGVERETKDAFAGKGRAFISLIGETNIFQMAAVFARCNLAVTNNSGPMHIAGAVKIPVVCIYGAAYNPMEWAPFGVSYRIILKEMECGFCLSNGKKCETYDCIKSVLPDAVCSVIGRFIKSGYEGQEIINV